MQTPRHLVSGTDFSECAERAIEMAIALALAARASVTVVHVCELGADDLEEALLRERGEALTKLIARHRGCGVEVTGVLRSGRPSEKLDNVAAEVGASLIVIGRQGAGRGEGVDIGSVADRMVRCASRPVLTVPCNL